MKGETRFIALQDGLVGPELSKNRFRLYRCDCDLKEGGYDDTKFLGYDCEYQGVPCYSNGELHFFTENSIRFGCDAK